MQPSGPLLGKGLPLGFLVYSVLLCFITFCPSLGVVLAFISIPDLCLFTYFLPYVMLTFMSGPVYLRSSTPFLYIKPNIRS